jgi:hypothetical protein
VKIGKILHENMCYFHFTHTVCLENFQLETDWLLLATRSCLNDKCKTHFIMGLICIMMLCPKDS